MTEEDEAPGAELEVVPVVAVQLLASPVAHLPGGEQGRHRGPESTRSPVNIYIGVSCHLAYILCREQRMRGQTEH